MPRRAARPAVRAEVLLVMRSDWQEPFHELHVAVVAADESNVVVYVNGAGERLLGWTASELVGRPLTEIMPERFRSRHEAGFARYVDTGAPTVMGRPLRVPVQRGDGREVEVELVVSAIPFADGPLMIGLLQDTSQRVELEGYGELADALVGALSETSALADAVPRILQGMGESLKCDVVLLWHIDADDLAPWRHAIWSSFSGARAAFVPDGDSFDETHWLVRRVLTGQRPVTIDDLGAARRSDLAGLLPPGAVGSAFGLPVISSGRIVGVFGIFSTHARGMTDELVARLTAVGVQIGNFIDRRSTEERKFSLLDSERAARASAEQAQARLQFLSEASTLVAGSLDLEETLSQVAALAVPTLGEWCFIHLSDGSHAELVAVGHVDQTRVDALRTAHESYPVDLGARDGVGRAIATESVVRHDQLTDAVLSSIARDERHLQALRDLGLASTVSIPLRAGGRCLGALTVATTRADELTDDVVQTAVELSRGAATAINNARLHRELQLQTALLRSRGEAGIEGQLVVGADGEMISHNRRFVEMWGMPDAVLNARSDDEALDVAAHQLKDPAGFHERVKELYASRAPSHEEVELRDGRVFDRVGTPLFDDATYLGYAWYFRDVTDHKQIESDLADIARTSAALAHTLQQSLLPPALPDIPGVQLGATYVPGTSGMQVGGDFYDVFRLGLRSWGLVIGDVCGHGAEAAATTSFARYTLRAAAAQTRSPARALQILNGAMMRARDASGSHRFVTVANARITPNRNGVAVVLAIGGHPLPVLRQASGSTTLVGRYGTLIGAVETVTTADTKLSLQQDDCLVMVTDGVVEARRDGELFGNERLLDVITRHPDLTAPELAQTITRAALSHAGGNVDDDIAVLVMRVT